MLPSKGEATMASLSRHSDIDAKRAATIAAIRESFRRGEDRHGYEDWLGISWKDTMRLEGRRRCPLGICVASGDLSKQSGARIVS